MLTSAASYQGMSIPLGYSNMAELDVEFAASMWQLRGAYILVAGQQTGRLRGQRSQAFDTVPDHRSVRLCPH